MLICNETNCPADDNAKKARHSWWAFLLCVGIAASLVVMPVFEPLWAGERTDFRVNDDAGSTLQADPRIAVAADGSFAIVWVDQRNLHNGVVQNDVYIQRFDTAGLPVGSNSRVNDDTTGAHQNQPTIGVDFSGRFSAIWLDYRRFGYPTNPDIFRQMFDDTLAPVGGNVGITTGATQREAPDIAFLPSGEGMAVWGDFRNGNWDIYGQLFDQNGVPVGNNFRVTDVSDSAQHTPRIASSARGWYVVTWQDKRFGNNDIFVQRLSATGIRLGPSLKVNTDLTASEQLSPDVATDGAGRFTVVWVDYRASKTNPDIYAVRLDTNLAFLTPNYRVNTDNTTRPQKYPAISADRMGNVAIIWADSVVNSWDIVGQMVDVDGVVQEANFQANALADSNQIKPDVGLDGAYRYVVWMDTRQDRLYDIFASITRYNDRALEAIPGELRFFMRQGGPPPDPQYIHLDHAGYNRIDFEVEPLSGWISVDPSGSTTPDSVAVTISSTSLEHGSYEGGIRIIDPLAGDSTLTVAVHLEVNAARLSLSVDTLEFRMPVGYDTVFHGSVSIGNSGEGTLVWTASEDADWLAISHAGGSAPDDLGVVVDGRDLTVGEYQSVIGIDAGYAADSPDSVVVILDVRDDIPIIALAPEVIIAGTSNPSLFDTAMVVVNEGGGNLSWSVSGMPGWLNLAPEAGTDSDVVVLTLNELFIQEGLNQAEITFVDTLAYNRQATASITIAFTPPPVDTVTVEPAFVRAGHSGVTGIRARLLNRLTSIHVPLAYDPALLSIDSLVFGDDLPALSNRYYRIEPQAGAVIIELDQILPDISIEPGEYLLGVMYFTAGQTAGATTIDAFESDTLAPVGTLFGGGMTVPHVVGGLITIDEPTGVEEGDPGEDGGRFALHQNYPNPFNTSTVVTYSVPEGARVRLDVYDVLGRRIEVLANGFHSRGTYQVSWGGADETGREMPSGVYFYRLQTPDTSIVAKMMLIK